MALYKIGNYAMPTTAAPVKVTTGTVIKTMLQVKASATIGFKVIEWSCSFDGSAAATPGVCELIETDVTSTVTAHVTSGIIKYDAAAIAGGDPVTNLIPVGTAATGFTASVEGTTTASRSFDDQFIAGTNQFDKQLPLGREPWIDPGKFLRIRVTFAAAINCLCWVIIEV